MRSASPVVFVCALACATAPAGSHSSSAGNALATTSVPAATAPTSALRGYILTGSFATEYFSGETLYDVLRRRAPIYLRPRGMSIADLNGTADPITVYIDGQFAGELDVLSLIPAEQVTSVQRLSASEAVVRYGPKRTSGALLVSLRKR